MQVLVNNLSRLPHHDGEDVLLVRAETFELQVRYHGGVCDIYRFAFKDRKPEWTKVARTESAAVVRGDALMPNDAFACRACPRRLHGPLTRSAAMGPTGPP